MIKIIWNIKQNFKYTSIKYFGTDFEKLMLEVLEEYFYQTSQGKSHQEAIEIIITRQFDKQPDRQRNTIVFVFAERGDIDKFYAIKYGSRGAILSHLHKLAQKIHIEEELGENSTDLDSEIERTNEILKKKMGTMALYMYERYHDID